MPWRPSRGYRWKLDDDADKSSRIFLDDSSDKHPKTLFQIQPAIHYGCLGYRYSKERAANFEEQFVWSLQPCHSIELFALTPDHHDYREYNKLEPQFRSMHSTPGDMRQAKSHAPNHPLTL